MRLCAIDVKFDKENGYLNFLNKRISVIKKGVDEIVREMLFSKHD